jgi:phage-related holin
MYLKKCLSQLVGKPLSFLLFMDFLKIVFWPDMNLLFWAGVCIMLDLLTGLMKSLAEGNFAFSTGFRKTISKMTQYLMVIAVCMVLANVVAQNKAVVAESLTFFGTNLYDKVKVTIMFMNNLVILLIIYVETLSVLENSLAINASSPFSKFVIAPIYKIVSLAVLTNAIKLLSDKLPEAK